MARPPDIAKRKATEADLALRLLARQADARDLAAHLLAELPTTPPEAAALRRWAAFEDVPRADRSERLRLAYAEPLRFFCEVAPTINPAAFDPATYRGLRGRPALVLALWTWGAGILLNPIVRSAFERAPGPVQAVALAVADRKTSTYGARGKDRTKREPRPASVDHVARDLDVKDGLFDEQAAREADETLPPRKRRRLPRGAVAKVVAEVAAKASRSPAAIKASRRKG